MGQRNESFEGRTVLLAGAGCNLGGALARSYAREGARVIVMDRDEARALKIARQDQTRMDVLRLDSLNVEQCHRFLSIWAEEPLHVLVHVQPIRHSQLPGPAIRSVLELTRGLTTALRRGQGRVLMFFRQDDPQAPLETQAFAPSWDRLPHLLDQALSDGEMRINGVRLPHRREEMPPPNELCDAALMLTEPQRARVSGSVLQLGPPSQWQAAIDLSGAGDKPAR